MDDEEEVELLTVQRTELHGRPACPVELDASTTTSSHKLIKEGTFRFTVGVSGESGG